LVAIEAGTVKRMRNGGLGGITVTLKGASGDEYYYAHLDGWATGLSVGQSLPVGGLTWQWLTDTGLELNFSLPAGSYATSVLRELVDTRT